MNYLAIIIILGIVFLFFTTIRTVALIFILRGISTKDIKLKEKITKECIEISKWLFFLLVDLAVLLLYYSITVVWINEFASNYKYLAIIPLGIFVLLPKILALITEKHLYWRWSIIMLLAGTSAITSYLIILFDNIGIIIASLLNITIYLGICLYFLFCNRWWQDL